MSFRSDSAAHELARSTRAQVWFPPAASSATSLPRSITWTGDVLGDCVVPSPSSPEMLSPQHQTVPSLVRAQV